MKTDIVPETKAVIEVAARKLAKSNENFLRIEGEDNQLLVKIESPLAQKMLNENMVLFPFVSEGKEYLVCVAEKR